MNDPTDPSLATEPAPAPERFIEDVTEMHDRAQSVLRVLQACEEELSRLECIPCSDPDDVNALSAAKGFVQRALAYLERRFA